MFTYHFKVFYFTKKALYDLFSNNFKEENNILSLPIHELAVKLPSIKEKKEISSICRIHKDHYIVVLKNIGTFYCQKDSCRILILKSHTGQYLIPDSLCISDQLIFFVCNETLFYFIINEIKENIKDNSDEIIIQKIGESKSCIEKDIFLLKSLKLESQTKNIWLISASYSGNVRIYMFNNEEEDLTIENEISELETHIKTFGLIYNDLELYENNGFLNISTLGLDSYIKNFILEYQ